jgi:hypothetical protein
MLLIICLCARTAIVQFFLEWILDADCKEKKRLDVHEGYWNIVWISARTQINVGPIVEIQTWNPSNIPLALMYTIQAF